MTSGPVITVLGPVDPAVIGPTSMHDHVFSDTAKAWWSPSSFEDLALTEEPLDTWNSGLARWNALGIRDNLILAPAEYDHQSREVGEFAAAGGNCLVDLTNVGLSPAPGLLARLSRDLGIHIVAGCGFYVHPTHPEWLERATVDEIAAAILRSVTDGIDGTEVRPGIIGEIGTSGELYECEERVLRAAAAAGSEAGMAVYVHTTATGRHAARILDLVEDEGLPPERLVYAHLDEALDVDYHRRVLDRGAVIGFDGFGADMYFGRLWKGPSDLEKMNGLVALLELGYENQLVLGQDVSLKSQLRRFGGLGYDHVLRRVAPALKRDFSVGEGTLRKLLVDNPRRILAQVGSS